MEKGLLAITGAPARVTAAGRTDAGVHARGQVVHLYPDWSHSLGDFRRAWNANLPADIAIRAVAPAPPGFHARFSARSRVYRYQIHNAPVRSPLRDRYAWHVRQALDVGLMEQAAAQLVGRHDLATFGKAPQGDNTVRTVLEARCWAEGELVCLEVQADAFLQHMMRRVAATLAAVGRGRLAPEAFGAIMRARDPALAEGLAPPCGLCLMAVRYAPGVLDWSLPSPESGQKESCFS